MKVKLKQLESAMISAQRAMSTALLAAYPKGKEIGVFLNCRQVNPTWVTVVGDGAHGHLRVRLVKPNRWGHHHVCDVHFERVVID